ncbi:MAG TPA: threonine synthase [Bacteroidales bacterium]|nr:threonine synthase [Bacteroidales bacterium]
MANTIQYHSTNLQAAPLSFREALLKGLAPDGGLFMPEKIPVLEKATIRAFQHMPYHEIAFSVLSAFLNDQIPADDLHHICQDAYNFDVPLEKVTGNNYVMRLDQGPTASFKDFAARMMGRLMQYYLKQDNRELLILTATSGDTGSAIANAFYDLENIKVVILYPKGEVTDRQRKQMTTLHKNISVIELEGKFDDCQALVKQAFSDAELDVLSLSSANSINIGRLLPQSVYYFYAYSRLVKQIPDEQIIFSVPSGNFGNLMGGVIAREMGLPVSRFVVSTNENDEFPVYLDTSKYKTIVPSKNCISSAMNVGHPSNMARLIAIYGGVMNENGEIVKEPDFQKINDDFFAVSVSDEITRQTITDTYKKYGVVLEPHGAVAWKGLQEFLQIEKDFNGVAVSLETAHPAKFPQEVLNSTGIEPDLPVSLQGLDKKEEEILPLKNNYEEFKAYLKDNF